MSRHFRFGMHVMLVAVVALGGTALARQPASEEQGSPANPDVMVHAYCTGNEGFGIRVNKWLVELNPNNDYSVWMLQIHGQGSDYIQIRRKGDGKGGLQLWALTKDAYTYTGSERFIRVPKVDIKTDTMGAEYDYEIAVKCTDQMEIVLDPRMRVQ